MAGSGIRPPSRGGSTGDRRPPSRRRVLIATTTLVAGLVGLLGCESGSSRPPPQSGSSPAAPSASASASSEATPLFDEPPSAAAQQSPDTSFGAILRSRYVSFRSDVIAQAVVGSRVSMTFFDEATYVGTIARIDRQELLTSWSGPLDGLPHSLFVVTRTGDRYQLTASTTRGTFAMNLTASGLYQVAQVDQPDVIDEPTDGGTTPPP